LTVNVDRNGLRLDRSSGGLVAGLEGPHTARDSTWVGWPGELPRLRTGQRREIASKLASERLVPVYLTKAEVQGFYEDVANSAIWPVFHYRTDLLPLHPQGWDIFRRVSEFFAGAVSGWYSSGDTIWVHDYHLILVPGLLRQSIPRAKIGFFLHIPFPAFEVFRVLPWREDILRGMLAANLVGFHTEADVEHFLDCARRLLGATTSPGVVSLDGHGTAVGAFPLGVDTKSWQRLSDSPEVLNRVAEIRQETGGRKILVGIDRLDYSKGLRHRMTSMEQLFEREPEIAKSVRLIQAVFPSREVIESYASFKRRLDETVGRINGRFSGLAGAPIHVISRNLAPRRFYAKRP
jgi:trehalose 6-phosphate synthase/phosphatase